MVLITVGKKKTEKNAWPTRGRAACTKEISVSKLHFRDSWVPRRAEGFGESVCGGGFGLEITKSPKQLAVLYNILWARSVLIFTVLFRGTRNTLLGLQSGSFERIPRERTKNFSAHFTSRTRLRLRFPV